MMVLQAPLDTKVGRCSALNATEFSQVVCHNIRDKLSQLPPGQTDVTSSPTNQTTESFEPTNQNAGLPEPANQGAPHSSTEGHCIKDPEASCCGDGDGSCSVKRYAHISSSRLLSIYFLSNHMLHDLQNILYSNDMVILCGL